MILQKLMDLIGKLWPSNRVLVACGKRGKYCALIINSAATHSKLTALCTLYLGSPATSTLSCLWSPSSSSSPLTSPDHIHPAVRAPTSTPRSHSSHEAFPWPWSQRTHCQSDHVRLVPLLFIWLSRSLSPLVSIFVSRWRLFLFLKR